MAIYTINGKEVTGEEFAKNVTQFDDVWTTTVSSSAPAEYLYFPLLNSDEDIFVEVKNSKPKAWKGYDLSEEGMLEAVRDELERVGFTKEKNKLAEQEIKYNDWEEDMLESMGSLGEKIKKVCEDNKKIIVEDIRYVYFSHPEKYNVSKELLSLEEKIKKCAIINLAKPENEQGVKHSQLKPNLALIFKQFPNALRLITLASMYGNNKYSETDKDGMNFSRVAGGIETYKSAMLRHLMEDGLDESGLYHEIHSAWNALAMLELFAAEKEINTIKYSEKYLSELK